MSKRTERELDKYYDAEIIKRIVEEYEKGQQNEGQEDSEAEQGSTA